MSDLEKLIRNMQEAAEDIRRGISLPGHAATLRQGAAELQRKEPQIESLLIAGFYNVVSDKISEYGGNTDRLAVYLQGVNDLMNEVLELVIGDGT